MNSKKRILSLFLALLMILSVFPTSLFAAEDEVKTKTEVVKSHKEGDKLVFDVLTARNPRRYNQQTNGFSLFRAGEAKIIDQKVTVSLATVGLNEGTNFDWGLLPSGLQVTVYFTDQSGVETEKQVVTLTQSNSSQEVTLQVPATGGTGKLHAEIPDIDNNLAIRVIRTGEATVDTKVGDGEWSFGVQISEITSPVINLVVKDPYGKPATAAGDVAAKLHVDGLEGSGLDIPFTISKGNTSFNLKQAKLLNGDEYDITELNYPGTNPTLTVEGEAEGKLTLGTGENAVEYKVEKTYTIENGGTITLTSQPKVITPQDPNNPGKVPDGYVRVTFTALDNGSFGKDAQDKAIKTKVFDVLEGKKWSGAKAASPAVTVPKPTADDGYKFKAWAPALPEDTTTVETKEYKASFEAKPVVTPTEPKIDDPNNPGTEITDPDYVTIEFLAGEGGTLEGTAKYWVLKGHAPSELAGFAAPKAKKSGSTFAAWDPAFDASTVLNKNATHTATYTKKPVVPEQTDAEKYTPIGKDIKVNVGVTPDPEKGIVNKDDLPSGTTYKWKNGVAPTTTTPGVYPGTVVVTYPDNSTDEVPVNIIVNRPGAGKSTPPTINQPTEGDITVKGTATPDSKVTVTLPDGTAINTKADGDGNWSVNTPVLVAGETIKAYATDAGKNPSEPPETTVKGKYTPPTYKYTTLTLDENYRSGEITHHDVLEGDLIERYLYTPHRRGYVFEGWSYNSRRLDEVRPGDRIYYSTTLYAIWSKQKAKDDEEVEPIDTREVGTHNAYMFGYTDGTVRPNGKITRAEAAALVTRLLDIEAYASDVKPNFPDTPSGWYNKAINAAVARGIMKGYPDGSFRPNAPITRAEFTQMISTIDNKPYGVAPFADVIGHWAERAIGAEYQAGRINGYPDGTFRPDAHITRAEAVVILNKIFDRNYDAMSAINCPTKGNIKMFSDLFTSFWGYNDMVEATNTHSFKRRVKGKVQEDWVEVK